LIAALVLAAATAGSLSFEGISLGDDAAKIGAAHAARATFTALGPGWSWRREGGGTMLIAGDAKGKIAVVDFAADQGESDAISLPGIPSFDVQDSHGALEKALGTSPVATCPSAYSGGFCGAFALAGDTELAVQFEGPGDGQLHRATWATAAILSKLQVLPPTVVPNQ
jgi:hypothetical protein